MGLFFEGTAGPGPVLSGFAALFNDEASCLACPKMMTAKEYLRGCWPEKMSDCDRGTGLQHPEPEAPTP